MPAVENVVRTSVNHNHHNRFDSSRSQYRIQLDEVRAHIESFLGDDSVERWVQEFTDVMESLNGSPSDFLRIGRMILNGSAAIWARGQMITGWEMFCNIIISEFHRDITMAEVYYKLSARVYRRPEPTHAYVIDMQAIARHAPVVISDAELIQYIVIGLLDPTVDIAVLLGCTTIFELKKRLMIYEARQMERALWEAKPKTVPPKQMVQSRLDNKQPPPNG